jgi:hypothetical protein
MLNNCITLIECKQFRYVNLKFCILYLDTVVLFLLPARLLPSSINMLPVDCMAVEEYAKEPAVMLRQGNATASRLQ